MKHLKKLAGISLAIIFVSASFNSLIYARQNFEKNLEEIKGDKIMNDLQKDDIKIYISQLGELKGEQVKLCDYLSDPESQRILAEHFINYDEESLSFAFVGANFQNAYDIMLFQKTFAECKYDKFWIIKDSENNPVGTLGLQPWEPLNGVNISCNIAKKYWGKGHALEATKTVMQKFYEDKVTAKIFIGAELENAKSLRALEKGAKALEIEDFDWANKTKVFSSKKYSLEQKEIKCEATYEIDDEDADYVICSFSTLVGNYRFLKRLIKPEFIETGRFDVKCSYCIITPAY